MTDNPENAREEVQFVLTSEQAEILSSLNCPPGYVERCVRVGTDSEGRILVTCSCVPSEGVVA